MIRFKLTAIEGDCEIAIDTDSAEKGVKHDYSGNKDAIQSVSNALDNAYGLYGHSIGESSPAIDLQYALFGNANMQELFTPEVIEGQEILDAWNPNTFPKDALS